MKRSLKRIREVGRRVLSIQDTHGQDLVEYALLAGFVAVAAGALLPSISTSISTIFSKMQSVLTAAGS
ncbi:MAG: Flp family type IVb pilin [Acidobacteria bacterium]|nr:Flp family type IVb pilin [Acidobacteriota bacterium]